MWKRWKYELIVFVTTVTRVNESNVFLSKKKTRINRVYACTFRTGLEPRKITIVSVPNAPDYVFIIDKICELQKCFVSGEIFSPHMDFVRPYSRFQICPSVRVPPQLDQIIDFDRAHSPTRRCPAPGCWVNPSLVRHLLCARHKTGNRLATINITIFR